MPNDMKTRKKTPPTSSIDLELPTSWAGLSDGHLMYVCVLFAMECYTHDEIKAMLLTRIAQAAGMSLKNAPVLSLADLCSTFDWIEEAPTAPVRTQELHGFEAVHPLLSGVPFSQYLALENYYQGFLLSQNNAALDKAAAILYPGFKGELSPAERYMLLLWLIGLKATHAHLFPELFRSSDNNFSEPPDQREVMNAEIRALTGGDITKTEAVLRADTLDALTELNAKAKETRQMNEQLKKSQK